MSLLPLLPVTVIVTSPDFPAAVVTRPVSLTVATDSLEDAYVYVTAPSSVVDGVSCTVPPPTTFFEYVGST